MTKLSMLFLLSIVLISHYTDSFTPHRTSSTKPCTNTLTTLYGSGDANHSKDNARARFEKNLEDMMDRDWRVFRAQLVAQETAERAEQERKAITSNSSTSASSNSNHLNNINIHENSINNNNKAQTSMVKAFSHSTDGRPPADSYKNSLDDKQARQEKFGNIFAAIFNSKNQDQDIFDGNTVGGASIHSMVPDSCKDPFVTRDEIPVLLQPKAKVNKHRWAHELNHIEPGCVLIANEKLGGVFHQTVVLVIEHNDVTGSTGIIINRPLTGNLNKIATETEANVDLSLKLAFNSSPVTYGGPVMQEEYSILHGYGEVEGSTKIAPGIFVGGSAELMTEVRKKNMTPSEALFVKGHAAWVPNQLAREVSKSVWYPASVSGDFILRYAGAPIHKGDNTRDLWADILTCIGGKYAEIAKAHSSKGDRRMKP